MVEIDYAVETQWQLTSALKSCKAVSSAVVLCTPPGQAGQGAQQTTYDKHHTAIKHHQLPKVYWDDAPALPTLTTAHTQSRRQPSIR
jgi:hypothetical protein